MKKFISWSFLIIVSIVIVLVSGYLLIQPGINDIKVANKIKIMSNEEITAAKKQIEEKYIDENEKLNQKYIILEKELEDEYALKEDEISKKYDTLEKELEKKYTKNMRDSKWYEEQTQLMNEKSALHKKENQESMSLTKEKMTKSSNLWQQKNTEQETLSKLKSNEITKINNHNNERKSIYLAGVFKIIAAIILIVIYISWVIRQFNKIITSKNRVKGNWSQIEVGLKRRYDLIPNLVATIKGLTKHESKTLEKITKIRTQALSSKNKQQEINLNNNMTEQINQILLLAEKYPTLKSNENYLKLQDELRNTEDEIAQARGNYNNAVLHYQNLIKSIPTNLFAIILGYKDELFFDIDDKEKELPKVDFTTNK